MKNLYLTLWTVFCLFVALIPEIVMYALYHVMNPQTEGGRIAAGGILLWFGFGASIFFAIVALFMWASGLDGITDAAYNRARRRARRTK